VANQYDVIVIGAGTGGYPAAIRAAQLGLSVAVVERQKALGGTCLNWGCIPTKALIEHAHALKVAQHAKEWGLTIDGGAVRIDMAQVQARKNRIVTGLTRGIEFLFKKNKIDWIKGTGRLGKGGVVEVGGGETRQISASREIVIATGSAPRTVPGVVIDRKRIITSDEAIGLAEVPASIIILGAGAIGVEFATIFRRFGSEVTIIELLPRLVPVEDEAVSAELQKAFRKQGIKVHTGSKVTAARNTGAEVEIDAELEGGTRERMAAQYLLVATGRGPVTDGLGAEEAGIALDRDYVRVDEHYRTSVPGISAIGDVITLGRPGHPQLAHVSTAEGLAVAERIAGHAPRTLNYDAVPACTYCEPEIGSVGLSEQKAKERGYDVAVGTFPFMALGRAKIAGEVEGFVKIVADRKYDEILGVHIIGLRATEVVAEASAAIGLECTAEELGRIIHAHPTMAEAMAEAAHAVHGRAIHI